MKLADVRRLVAQRESPTLEFKRSTGELREGMEALCGMLNGAGRGRVLFGVSDGGELLGQAKAEKTLREIANASRKIEPAAEFRTSWVPIRRDLGVLVVEAVAQRGRRAKSPKSGPTPPLIAWAEGRNGGRWC